MELLKPFSRRLSVIYLLTIWTVGPVYGAVVSLPSTGTDAGGISLPGGMMDPHYTISGPGVPSGGPQRFIVRRTFGFNGFPMIIGPRGLASVTMPTRAHTETTHSSSSSISPATISPALL